MTTRADHAKLAEFRARTDRQLHALVSRKLDRGLSFATLLLGDEGRERWASLEELTGCAERSYKEVARLLPLLRGISSADRRRLESRLDQLREILDCATLCATPRTQAAAML